MLPFFSIPRLTQSRMIAAVSIAAAVDLVQLFLGPIGIITFLDDGLDVLAMILISLAVGFHPLLLPTFLIELLPLVDMVPTWTGCTIAVVLLRKRSEAADLTPRTAPEAPPTIKPAQVLRDEPAAPSQPNDATIP